MRCPECGGTDLVRNSYKMSVKKGKRLRMQCKSCARTFYAPTPRKKSKK